MSLNPSSFRVNDVITYVKRQFGDESGVQITDSDIIRWTNQAVRNIAFTAKAIQGTATTLIVAGTYKYSLPSDAAFEITTINVQDTPVQGLEFQMAQSYIQENDPKRNRDAEVPTFWWRWGNEIFFWPTPNLTNSVITIYFIGVPSTLSTTDAYLGLPDKYYEAVLQFVMSKAYELDEDAQASQAAYQRYMDQLGQTFEEDKAENLFYPVLSFVED